jgi:hypothetical protein
MRQAILLLSTAVCCLLTISGAQGPAGPPATKPATQPVAGAIESVVPGRMVCCAACKAKQDVPGGIGHCSVCGDGCNMANKFCTKCAMKAGACEVCGKQMTSTASRPATQPASAAAVAKIDLTQSKVYQSGKWKYSYQITFGPGALRMGANGTLSYDGRVLPSAGAPTNNYYETPWGKLYDTGQPNTPSGPHEWMPSPCAGMPVGKQLPDPAGPAVR